MTTASARFSSVAAYVAGWHGPVFVKGSRRYELEKIFEAPPAPSLPC